MKRLILIFALFFYVVNVNAIETDSSKILCDYLVSATNLYCKGKYKKALKVLKSFRGTFPDHILAEEISYNIGLCYLRIGKLEYAENIFINILYTNTPDEFEGKNEISQCNHFIDKCNFHIFPEVLLNIKHEACIRLAEIEFQRKNYNSALQYITNADTFYRYFYGCGTDDMQEDLRLSLVYSDYYEKKDELDSAIWVMLPLILEPSAFPMRYYKDVTKKTADLLHIRYNQKELNVLMEKAIEDIYFHENPGHEGSKPTRIYFIKFLDREVQVAPTYLFGKNYNPDEVKAYIRRSEFYKLVNGNVSEQ